MTILRDIAPERIGLRCYDIALGLRNLDVHSGWMTEFRATHIAGMAANLASVLKGRDIIRDASALKRIAADVLKIDPYAFDQVVVLLDDLELIRNVRRGSGGQIASFDESVPMLHDDVLVRLGTHWETNQPTESEQQLLVTVQALAQAPRSATKLHDELGVDLSAASPLRAVGERAELVRPHLLRDGTEIVASPLYAFEQPDTLVDLFESHSPDQVRATFERVRRTVGLAMPLTPVGQRVDPILADMIKSGLVSAPTVIGADRTQRAFVTIPYGLDATYLTTKKQVLDRALALVACVRCGQVSGGATPIRFPSAILGSLLDKSRDHTLSGHSSTERQYAPLIALGMITPVRPRLGGLVSARLVPTPENIDAVRLARTLLERQGEGLPERGNEREAADLLFTGSAYLSPIETISTARHNAPTLTVSEFEDLWEHAAGRGL